VIVLAPPSLLRHGWGGVSCCNHTTQHHSRYPYIFLQRPSPGVDLSRRVAVKHRACRSPAAFRHDGSCIITNGSNDFPMGLVRTGECYLHHSRCAPTIEMMYLRLRGPHQAPAMTWTPSQCRVEVPQSILATDLVVSLALKAPETGSNRGSTATKGWYRRLNNPRLHGTTNHHLEGHQGKEDFPRDLDREEVRPFL